MSVRLERQRDGELPRAWIASGVVASLLLGAAIGAVPLLAFLAIALAVVVIAVLALDRIAVLVFWTLPYMVANMPTGSFTLKVPEVVGYLFATAYLARSLIRRERVVLPPATLQFIAYLMALVVAALFAPPVPTPYLGGVMPYDRNSPALRPMSIVIWLALSWLLVVALYNLVGSRPRLLWKCVRAHILSGGLAAVISLAIYVLALRGTSLVNIASGGLGRSLVTESGEGFRLAGVAYEPLFLAFYLQTVIPMTAVALLAYPNWIPRWVSAICLGAQLMALMLTVSAGGWMGALVGLSLLLPAHLGRRLSRKAQLGLFAGLAVVVCLVVVTAVAQKDFSRIASSAAGKVLSGGDRVRAGEWEAGLRMFEARPFTGMGPGLTSYHFPRYHPERQSQVLRGLPEVNNLYINELASAGVIGFVLFAWLALVTAAAPFRQLRRWRPHRTPVLTALCASLVGCMVQYMSLNPLFLIYFCATIGLTLATTRAAAKGTLEPDNQH